MEQYKFWVAEDGSTYWSCAYDEDADGTYGPESKLGYSGGSVNVSAAYAMLYSEDENGDPDGLAQGAYDARFALATGTDKEKHEAARSPAVNMGTDDAYGYDSTSTQATVIDLGQPDIGYHYYRRIADDDDPDGVGDNSQKIYVTFQPSKEKSVKILDHELTVPGEGFRFVSYDRSKAVVNDELGYQVERGNHSIQVTATGDGGSGSSEAVEIKLIVDPDKPVIE